MSDKNDIKRVDVKLHNFMVRYKDNLVQQNGINRVLGDWVVFVGGEVMAPKIRESSPVCMSAIK